MINLSLTLIELQFLIRDAEHWASTNEECAYVEKPGPERDNFMRQAIDLHARANQLRLHLPRVGEAS